MARVLFRPVIGISVFLASFLPTTFPFSPDAQWSPVTPRADFTLQSLLPLLPLLLGRDQEASAVRGAEEHLRVPEGFQVELFADDDLAHDIHCMTIDSQGRIVVSGPGYVRILVDTSGDGRADEAISFAEGPATGAQGMLFDGHDLLYVGEGGLLRFHDRDGDGRADGPPEMLLPIRTGGEHHAHAIRRGPEGSWYLLAGNDAGIGQQHAEGIMSPVKLPEAGALLRLSPDFSLCEVFADGFRNAYDFDFGPQGDVFVYDSDDERDISLPWYRPTRVFQVVPGSHAGWLSRSWKRPDYFFEMPPVVASVGRGSPTGVVSYQHHQFPEPYRRGLFVADWTFGRVHYIPLEPGSDGTDFAGVMKRREPREFIAGRGQFGFAPTDLEVGPEGDLFISVGGRGTRGGVYRVRWTGSVAAEDTEAFKTEAPKTSEEPGEAKESRVPIRQVAVDSDLLDRCLQVPQPLSSWGRAVWIPLAEQLGGQQLRDAVVDSARPELERCRAIEILTELHGGLEPMTHRQLLAAPASVRARAAWSLGVTARRTTDDATASELAVILLEVLQDQDAAVLCRALESLHVVACRLTPDEFRRSLSNPLQHDSRWVRQLAARVIAVQRGQPGSPTSRELEAFPPPARFTILFGLVERPRAINEEVFWQANALLAEAERPGDWLQLLRVMQLAAGDLGPGHDLPAAFDGYASRLGRGEAAGLLREFPLSLWVERVEERERVAGRAVRKREWERQLDHKPDPIHDKDDGDGNDPGVDGGGHGMEVTWTDVREELGRVAAMVSAIDPAGLQLAMTPLTNESHPTEDLHGLLVAARLAAPMSSSDRRRIASVLVQLDAKLASRHLNQDRNWGPRLAELYEALRKRVPNLGEALLSIPEFGQPAHAWLVEGLTGVERHQGLARVMSRTDPSSPPSRILEVVRLAGESAEPSHRTWLRGFADHPTVKGAVLVALAPRAEEVDRALLVQGLGMWQPEVVRASLRGLRRLPPRDDPEEWGALVRILTKWNRDRQEMMIRDHAAQLLQRGTGRAGHFQTGEAGYRPQEEAVQEWVDWWLMNYPDVARRSGLGESASSSVDVTLAEVPWDAGDAQRGETLFHRKACGLCHSGRSALGPDLTGVTQRFSRRDLFVAILDPNRDVSSRYATTVIETHDGLVYRGAVIYEAVDGLTLSTGALQTVRIERSDIARQGVSPISLMPTGLMDDCQPRDYADLLEYLRTLSPQ